MLLINLAQLIQHQNYFRAFYNALARKETPEKLKYMIGFPYKFAVNCRSKYINGHTNGRLLTDWDIQSNPGMTYQREIAYYIYPIKIRGNNTNIKPDYLVFFDKTNAESLVPANYVIKVKMDEQNLLAVRKDLF
ncbi:MAG: hypothetical protein HQL26_05215 [Candidatus Omnitrophica bacterium]|nr:hypothetical protein [Candidatus Omnitrophota bacterium]